MTYKEFKKIEKAVSELINEYQGKTDLHYINEQIEFSQDEIRELNPDEYLDILSQELDRVANDNNMLSVDITYHDVAMDYLKQNDPSLQTSLSMANDIGYSVEDINSELLASLLATEEEKGLFSDFLNELKDLNKEG